MRSLSLWGDRNFYVKPLIIKTVDTLSYKTVSLNTATVNKEWLVIDATDLVLGRLASRVALVLRGKNKPGYTPHVDCGDNVIIVNADKIRLTGKKMTDRVYTRYTGYPGGQRFTTPKEILASRPERPVSGTSSSITCTFTQVLSTSSRHRIPEPLSLTKFKQSTWNRNTPLEDVNQLSLVFM